jgi:putative membrane protein
MTQTPDPRRPRVFAPNDPALVVPVAPVVDETSGAAHVTGTPPHIGRATLPSKADVAKGFRFGALLVAALVGLASLAASLAFARFVSSALARDDWIGWLAFGLLYLAAISAFVLICREIMGLSRLARLGRVRRDIDAALASKDRKAERDSLGRLKALYLTRPDQRWGLARLAEHERDIHDTGALTALADRELMLPLDTQARRLILASAKRVSTVTAISPIAVISVGFVLIENLGLLRRLAGLYGGRPGFIGSLRLGRLVITHLIGTGAVALTDDLLGQFLGQDVLRRLSSRLGEGAFNGALTVRLGAAAIDVVRPLPFIDAPPVRARDIIKELFVSVPNVGGKTGTDKA